MVFLSLSNAFSQQVLAKGNQALAFLDYLNRPFQTRMFSGPSNSERGGILVFVGVAALVLILFIGLAIDTSGLAASKTQQRQMAEKLSLAALHSFNISGEVANDLRTQDALTRAQQILDIGELFEDNFKDNPTAAKTLTGNALPSATEFGSIRPGRWFFEAPDCPTGIANGDFSAADSCPCPGGVWSKPCFQEADVTDSIPDVINSFRTQLETQASNPINTLFSGVDNIQVGASAIGAMRPKNVVFLVDLSRSSTNETHFPFKQVSPHYHSELIASLANSSEAVRFSSEYAFQLEDVCPTDISDCYAGRDMGAGVGCDIIGDGGAHDAVWNYLIAEGPPVGAPNGFRESRATASVARASPPLHYYDDYLCYQPYDSRFDAYLVDTYCQEPPANPAVTCGPIRGPEPLNSMLYGVRQGMEMLTVIDSLGVIGFDRSAKNLFRRFHAGIGLSNSGTTDEAALSPTLPFTLLPAKQSSGAPSNAMVDRLRNILEVESPTATSFRERILNHAFFPRRDASANIGEALREALELLKNTPSFDISENLVILFSDGLSNCTGTGCAESYDKYLEAQAEIESILINDFVNYGVQLHLFLIGNHIAPHELLRRGLRPEDRSCMTPEQAAIQSRSLTAGCTECPDPDLCTSCPPSGPDDVQRDIFDDMKRGNLNPGPNPSPVLFKGPNQLFSSVVATGGKFITIRKPCDPSVVGLSNTDCQEGGLESLLEAECASLSTEGEILTGSSLLGSEQLDSEGRLLCNPSCSSKRQQIFNELDEILSAPPYVIVE